MGSDHVGVPEEEMAGVRKLGSRRGTRPPF